MAVPIGRPGASSQAVQHHYDVGNEFYRLWLDPTMTYSAAMWDPNAPDDTLERAQSRKWDYLIDQARASRAARVLDVGCGWGAQLRRLVTVHGVASATGITPSHEQARWIAAFNDPRIAVELGMWWDHRPEQPYDAIISCEALEHFARPEYTKAQKVAAYQSFFARCHQWLKPEGRLVLQVFAFGTGYTGARGFSPAAARLLPETEMPALGELVRAAEKLFNVVAVRNDPQDVQLTGQRWVAALETNRVQAEELMGAERVDHYLAFLRRTDWDPAGDMALWRITLRRCDSPVSDLFAGMLVKLGQ